MRAHERVETACIHGDARLDTGLSEMLDRGVAAVVVLTAETPQLNGKLHPRLNVVHEIGLFQGRLGFRKVAVLREDGIALTELTNLDGLTVIDVPREGFSSTAAAQRHLRGFLEREHLT